MRKLNSISHYLYIFRNYVLKSGKPFLASFKLTYRCNLTCQQCPFHVMTAPELTIEEVKRMLDRLYERGNRMIVFEGGEPFLWSDGAYRLRDVVAYARKKFFSVGITTNGTLPLDVESDSLWVSLDGLKETHDRLREAPIFDMIMQNINSCQHPRLFVHITVNSQNAAEIPDLIHFLKGKVRGITIQFYYPYNHQDELFLDFDRRETFISQILDMKKKGYPILNSRASLKALKHNTWKCRDDLLDCANPDGSITQGCYLRSREDIDCRKCGFSPHTELSLACKGNLDAIRTGMKVFF
ncbi:MAG: radical SAM protein [Anaerolineaceae bacterium]|nr:radical SAM protein [Anaerolineaceae bacterium]